MAVLKETTIHRYIGLAGDTRPTGVPVGSTYLAYDTDALEITHNGTDWVQIDRLLKLVANSGVDIGDVDVTSVVPGVGATSLGKAEDAVHASGDTGVAALAVRKDTAAGLAVDGDYHVLEVDASGRLYIAPLVAGSAIVGKVGIDQTTPGTTNAVAVVADTGAYTTPTHSVATVTTVSGAALASNANRLYALFVNDSDTAIYIMLGAAAVANQGIRLNANGGSYEMSKKVGSLYTGAVNAIHAGTGNKSLLVLEGV